MILSVGGGLLIAGVEGVHPSISLRAAELGAEPSATYASCPRAATFKLAIDIGHTPESKGATSARGEPELEFNTALAKKIEYALRASGYRKLSLISAHGAGRAQLMARTTRINGFGVDLLLSVHHDSVQPQYLQQWTFEGQRHEYSDRFSGFSLFISRKNKYFERSRMFAGSLGTELSIRSFARTLHHAENVPGERRDLIDPDHGIYAYDDLVVLKETRAPAVLLEAGVIVNRDEEVRLKKPERQELMAAAVVAAVDRFCASSK